MAMRGPSYLSKLEIRFGRKLPVLLQAEAAECGLVCIAMVLNFHGHRIDMLSLRRDFAVSLKGATLKQLIACATDLDLSSRPLRLEIEELPDVVRPCILHWNLSHFVVLKKIIRNSRGEVATLVIHDPARGEVKVGVAEASKRFTGVALELTPTGKFQTKNSSQRIKLREVMGRIAGLKRSLVQILLLALALEVFALVSPFYMQWVVDGAILSGDRGLLNVLTLGFGLLMLIQVAIGIARSWAVVYMSTFLSVQWVANVFSHMLRLPVTYFERRHLGDVTSRFGAVGAIQSTLTTTFLEAIIDGLLGIATLIVMLFYSVQLSLIVFGSIAIYAALRWAAYAPFRRASEEQIVLVAREQTIFLESIRAIQSIKIFNREDDRRSRWLNAFVLSMNRGIATQKMNLWFGTAHGLIGGVENLFIVWLGALMIMRNELSLGMIYAYMSYKSTFTGRVYSLIDKYIQFRMLSVQTERLGDIVLTPTEDEERRLVASRRQQGAPDGLDQLQPSQSKHHFATESGQGPQLAKHNIEAREVCFRYSDSEPWVLDRVSFRIDAGESVAFIGPSGCGKTTMIRLLTGLLSPQAGDVLVGSRSLRRIPLAEHRNTIGVVMQEDQLLTGSLAENISFFDENCDQPWVENCGQLAAIDEEIRAMPMGYRTLIGDMGSSLSGGQKQRILLARALYKRPAILLLDEATSHLDLPNESRIISALSDLSITRIIVAHRAETISSVDRVIIFGTNVHETSGVAAIHA